MATDGCRYSGQTMLNFIQIPCLVINSVSILINMYFTFFLIRNWNKDLWLILGFTIQWGLFALFFGGLTYISTIIYPLETLISID